MKQILIVDDNENLRYIFKMMLNEFDVIEAENGLMGMSQYEKYKPDIILMDILMPEMDGITATRNLVKLYPDIIIMGVTAYTNRAEEIIKAGAKKVLIKPIRKDDFIAEVKELL